jgi:hypothetical protein
MSDNRDCPGGVIFRTRPDGTVYPLCPSGWVGSGRRSRRSPSKARGKKKTAPSKESAAPKKESDLTEE